MRGQLRLVHATERLVQNLVCAEVEGVASGECVGRQGRGKRACNAVARLAERTEGTSVETYEGILYDDEVHLYLGIPPERGQVVYHFAIGYPVPDPRVEG